MDVDVNGELRVVSAPDDEQLLRVLREELGLTGTKSGCGARACGACTVLVDGQPALSCAISVADAAGRSVITIEGLEEAGGTLHPVQRAFLAEQAVQCGWCTPAQILTSIALLKRTPRPDEEAVREGLSTVVCRCGTYQRAVAAVLRASGQSADGEPGR